MLLSLAGFYRNLACFFSCTAFLFFSLAFPAEVEATIVLLCTFRTMPGRRWRRIRELFLDDRSGSIEILIVSNP
jgi:hypothetical protein